MRHRHGYRKLGREASHRRAMLRNMATSFMKQGQIQTTLPKAKELRRVVEKIITWGKRGDLHARRLAAGYLFDDDAVNKLFSDIAPKFQDRGGGYTRIVRTGVRFGDGAHIAKLELVGEDAEELAKKVKTTKPKKK